LQVESFGQALKDRDGFPPDSNERRGSETLLASIVDVFNTGIDSTIHHGQEIIPELADLALIEDTEAQKREVVDYASRAAQLIADRQARIVAFKRRFRPDKRYVNFLLRVL
jgi:hypothetical protein